MRFYCQEALRVLTARANTCRRYSDGTLRVVSGDLVPHLTQTQINSLLSFMAAMRTKANAEILP